MKAYNEQSLVNLSNSILKHFHAETFHDSIPEIDEALKGHKKVVAVLFDGMGRNIVHKHFRDKSFLRRHYVTTINSTFPPTTAAATTAFLTGKYPIETGWIAWDTYFKDYNRNIILFTSQDYNSGERLIRDGERNIADRYYPTTKIFELIEKGDNHARAMPLMRFPIQRDGPKSLLGDGIKKLDKVLKENDECFVYFYWDETDRMMHENGIDHWKVRHEVKKAERFLKNISRKNKDTLFIFLADHGHINYKLLDICEHDDLYSLIDKPLSMEKRATSFYIKKEKEAEFVTLFNKYYGDKFELLSKKEVLELNLFGEGKPAPGVIDSFGDYLAVAIKEYGIFASKEFKFTDNFKGHHAGGTEEERLIDISIFSN